MLAAIYIYAYIHAQYNKYGYWIEVSDTPLTFTSLQGYIHTYSLIEKTRQTTYPTGH